MDRVDHEVERYLTLLRNKIRERGFTQLEVQEALGWGRSYISQLLTRQKNLRVEQILLILNVIGIEPADFFAEFYGGPRFYESPAIQRSRSSANDQVQALRQQLHAVTELLLEKKLITAEGLSEAVAAAGRDSGSGSDLP
ncbi:MAG: helix-turn-helix transcriptional regulator [Acidobacteriota bacterium]